MTRKIWGKGFQSAWLSRCNYLSMIWQKKRLFRMLRTKQVELIRSLLNSVMELKYHLSEGLTANTENPGMFVNRIPLVFWLAGEFLLGSLDKISVVEIPYLEEKVSMFVVLPSNRRTSLARTETYFSAQTLSLWSSTLRRTAMDIVLPR